jgi:pimeloyl-ACP methyl ester carboxylesterase
VWQYAKKITCPVLAIRGEFSDIFYADAAERLNNIIADFELQTIPQSGHFPPMEKPEQCARLIADFVHRKIRIPS